jgi:type I restriction enzyme S subunit
MKPKNSLKRNKMMEKAVQNDKVVAERSRRYESYKDSGIEWLGDIPEHWEALANKFIFNLKKKQVGKKSGEYDLLSLTLKGVVVRDLDAGGKFPAEFDTYQEVKKGDFIFCLFDVEETPRCVGLSDFEGMITGAYTVMEPKENFDRSFIYYFYLNLDADKRMKPLYTGLRNTISKDNFFAFKTFVPPLSEQTKIAKFLDDKTTKIEAAIAIKEQQINLLKERKQILIHKAVTRGLNPNVKLKDSGVEWIGEIPEGWEVKKVKHVTSKIGSGVTPSGGGTTYLNKGIPLLRSQNIFFDKIELDGVAFISDKVHQSMNNSQVFKGDVLLNITGGSIGRCYFVDIDIPLNVNQHVCILRPSKKITTLYLNSLIASQVGQNQIWFHQQGGGREGLNFQALKNFSIPFPPLSEQKEIAVYIENGCQKIETAIGLKQQEIAKLKEYKSSLINSVVTGKIKVC